MQPRGDFLGGHVELMGNLIALVIFAFWVSKMCQWVKSQNVLPPPPTSNVREEKRTKGLCFCNPGFIYYAMLLSRVQADLFVSPDRPSRAGCTCKTPEIGLAQRRAEAR
ncbi:hypothetical protein CSUB01_08982 [Colletotrichum sublineola]|uniref:Uncharacterized protein n=1 Tax=Colletotrichum sublineola TaxID=1173701 RepID=A0A066XJE3_COLSU|nr:hypothetical protein CSUB01_08982 [Colletotrichum sublineola]